MYHINYRIQNNVLAGERTTFGAQLIVRNTEDSILNAMRNYSMQFLSFIRPLKVFHSSVIFSNSH